MVFINLTFGVVGYYVRLVLFGIVRVLSLWRDLKYFLGGYVLCFGLRIFLYVRVGLWLTVVLIGVARLITEW